MWILKQFDYLLRFTSQQVRVFEEALEKKWLKNHIDLKENACESPICLLQGGKQIGANGENKCLN